MAIVSGFIAHVKGEKWFEVNIDGEVVNAKNTGTPSGGNISKFAGYT